MEMTTLCLRLSLTDAAVWVAPSHGVAMTTTSAPAAVALSPAEIGRSRSGHCSCSLSTASMARYFEREPMTTS